MQEVPTARHAAVALSEDPDPRRAGLLAAAEAASVCGRQVVRTVLLFAAGSHASATARVARGAAEHLPDATVLVVGGGGVLSPEGETEGASAVTALTLGSPIEAVIAEGPKPAADAASLGRLLGAPLRHDYRRPTMVFCQPRIFSSELVAAFEQSARPQVVIGGGLAPDGRLALVEPGSEPRTGLAAALRFDGGVRMAVGVSPGVQQLTEPLSVDEMDRGFVRSLGGRRPLDVLSEAVEQRTDRPLVLAAIAPPEGQEQRTGTCLVRAITGVDPTHGSVHVGEEVVEGDRMAFACLDPGASRQDLESTLREVERATAGGVPLAGIYVDCAGRGVRLYGRVGVDARLIRDRLRDLPFAGMHSSFEIAPFGDRARVHTFTGVLGLLYAPS